MKKSIKHCTFADKAVSYDRLRLGVLSHQAPIIVLPIRKPTKITTENVVCSLKKNCGGSVTMCCVCNQGTNQNISKPTQNQPKFNQRLNTHVDQLAADCSFLQGSFNKVPLGGSTDHPLTGIGDNLI